MNLILLERSEVVDPDAVTLSDNRAAHLIGVLGATPGRTVRIGVVDGPLGTGTVTSVEAGAVTMRCDLDTAIPPAQRADLLLALPRPKVMRRLWPQIAALGVGRVLLTNAARVERPYFDTHVLAPEVYRPLLIEGLQQARDTRLPEVSIHKQLKVLVEDHLDALSPHARRMVGHPDATTPLPAAIASREERVLIAVGPEGGWTPYELDLFRAHRFEAVGMGSRTLRADTACIALLTLVHHGLRSSAAS